MVGTGLAAPTPLRAMVCGLFAALSVRVTTAARLPIALGLKINVRLQEAEGASVAGQEFVTE